MQLVPPAGRKGACQQMQTRGQKRKAEAGAEKDGFEALGHALRQEREKNRRLQAEVDALAACHHLLVESHRQESA
eukprot:COSAG05_NODE_7356_length_823_cov_1.291436_2_plen_74_part_01